MDDSKRVFSTHNDALLAAVLRDSIIDTSLRQVRIMQDCFQITALTRSTGAGGVSSTCLLSIGIGAKRAALSPASVD